MHCKTWSPVLYSLLPHATPVLVTQPQHWANTNRPSFITVWQKHTRLESNPPKTTTLSSRIIQSPIIRGKQKDTAPHITQQESTLKKNNGEMRRYCSTWLAWIKREVLSFCAWGDGWTTGALAWKLMMWLEETVAPSHSFLCPHEGSFGLKLEQMYLLCALEQRIGKISCSSSIKAVSIRTMHFSCSIHSSLDWCGLLHCRCSTSYFTVYTKTPVQKLRHNAGTYAVQLFVAFNPKLSTFESPLLPPHTHLCTRL